ncbi:Macrolide export ATP-binding/permease protein MacB [Corynebacterium heidelbergense]|nr:Macrolide export ATP-binding/permease protein MacB [Corynebacterium heidelbergense]
MTVTMTITQTMNHHSPAPTSSAASGLRMRGITLDVQDGSQRRRILDSVDLDVAAGEVLGITGPSGSGKSTLLAVAGCLQAPTAGRAQLLLGGDSPESTVELGRDTGRAAARIRRNHIGFVFQQPNLWPALRVMDQLRAVSRLDRILPMPRSARRAVDARAAELLEAVGLADMGARRVGELSGGQQARVNVARALMNRPQLLLVDEPTAALDTASGTQVTQLIERMALDNGAATLYVSHDAEQLAALNRVLTLVDGKVA